MVRALKPCSTLFPYTTLFRSPLINITLQGRQDTYPKRRGMTRVLELMAANVNVAFGHDCVMDPWYALGSGDMLERSEEHTSELQSRFDLVCRLLLEKKNTAIQQVEVTGCTLLGRTVARGLAQQCLSGCGCVRS